MRVGAPRVADHRRLRRAAGVLLTGSLVVLSAACGSVSNRSVSATTPTAARQDGASWSNLEVDGAELALSSGTRFVVKGVDVYAVPFYNDGSAPDPSLEAVTEHAWDVRDALFSSIRDAGANTVRIEVSNQVYNDDVYGFGGSAGYVERIKDMVEAATGAGLHVIVVWGDAVGESAALVSEYSEEFPMMEAVARALRDDPNVIYEPYNEPNGMPWSQWLGIMESTLTFWQDTIGYRGPLLLDTPRWSWDFDPTYASTLITYDQLLIGRSDVVFANHQYPNHDTCFCGAALDLWQSEIGQYTRDYPILGTEYGIDNGVGPTNLAWGQQFLAYVANVAIPNGLDGASAFTWNWVNDDTMVNLTTGALTTWGKVVQSELLSRSFGSLDVTRTA